MRAIRYHAYGSPDVLRLEEVDPPEVPDDGVLVRVRAASVNAVDWHAMRGEPFLVRMSDGLRRPKSPSIGVDAAGIVEVVGRNVTDLQPGDEVFGARTGAFAELVAGRNFVRKPRRLSFEEAAAIPVAASTALQAIRDKGRLQAGQRILITGAAGGVGHFAVQIAKALGAHVTAETRGPVGVDLARRLGATETLDAEQTDVTASGSRFDLILDVAGRRGLTAFRRVLAPGGTFVVVGGPGGRWIRPADRSAAALMLSPLTRQRFLPFFATITKEDLVVLRDLAETGRLTPVIDRTYPLDETADAIRYVGGGGTRGKVVIAV